MEQGTGVNYLDHLARDSARFAAVLRSTAPQAPVPSCPGWDANDLLWHLGEVQWFWSTVVREGVTREQAEAMKPDRPAGRDRLLAFYQRASRDLGVILAARAPDSPAWTWSADHTVGFVRRRQAHEALIHRVDAELTAGERTGMDARLSADGVDEALRVMYGGEVPGWGTFTPASADAVRLSAVDTGDSWLVTVGRFTGTDPGGPRLLRRALPPGGRTGHRRAGRRQRHGQCGRPRLLAVAPAARWDRWSGRAMRARLAALRRSSHPA